MTQNNFIIEIEYIARKLSYNIKPINIDAKTLIQIFFPQKITQNIKILQYSTNLKLDILKDFRHELSDIYRNTTDTNIIYNLIRNIKNLPYISLKLYQHGFIN